MPSVLSAKTNSIIKGVEQQSHVSMHMHASPQAGRRTALDLRRVRPVGRGTSARAKSVASWGPRDLRRQTPFLGRV